MDSKLHILQHSLGVGDYGDKPSHRNHFVTGPSSTDYDNCMALVDSGLMTRRDGSAISGGDDIFRVTQKGIDFIALNSPKKPPERKLTRAKQNYQNWLDADCGLPFWEYMGFRRKSQ